MTVQRRCAGSILRSIAALTLGVLATLVVTAAPVAAAPRAAQGACDPAYGCNPPPPTEPLHATCTVSATAGRPGDMVSATLTNVAVGIHVRLLFDGQQVAEGDTVAMGATGGITLTFAVPSNASNGQHTLVFAGAGIQCDPFGGAGFQVTVEGEVLARSDSGGKGNSGGSLARTGIELALFLAIALVLFLLGSAALRAARRRRRRLERVRERQRQRHRLRV